MDQHKGGNARVAIHAFSLEVLRCYNDPNTSGTMSRAFVAVMGGILSIDVQHKALTGIVLYLNTECCLSGVTSSLHRTSVADDSPTGPQISIDVSRQATLRRSRLYEAAANGML